MEPPRGFSVKEFETRTAAVQAEMVAAEIDALLLTTEPEVRYFSGFLSQFWESPTRPWFLVVPAAGKPIAVVPEIGAAGFAATWLDDIRTWPAPRPEDDGISLLAELLKPCRRLGVQLGHESHLRMPMGDFASLGEQITQTEITDATDILRRQMVVKSDAEIAKIRHACQIASEGFIALPDKATMGDSERDVCRKLRLDIIARGADSVPYMVAGSGPGGYDNIIMGPNDRVPDPGDILIIDTGARYDGYFCDFDRNFAFGPPTDAARRAHAAVWQATEAGFAAARPGVTTSELCAVMWTVLEEAGALSNDVGRLGHGLGTRLTEWPSLRPGDDTVLAPGMVITLEPGMEFAPGKLMVHEENIVIRDGQAEMLSTRAAAELPIIS